MPDVVLIVSFPDICLLPYFKYSHEYRLKRNTVYCAILSDQIVVGCPLGVPISYHFYICKMLLRGILNIYGLIMISVWLLWNDASLITASCSRKHIP